MAFYKGEDVVDTVLSRLSNNDRMFTRASILKHINNGLQLTNLFVGWYQTTETIVTVKDRVGYGVPKNIIFPTSLYFNGKRVNKSPFSSLIANIQNLWKATTNTEYVGVSEWALHGLRTFVIYPADGVGGNTLEISGVAEPTLFSSETDSLNVPSNVMNTVIDYATHSIQVKFGGKVLADSMAYFKNFAAFNRANVIWRQKQQPYFNFEISVKE